MKELGAKEVFDHSSETVAKDLIEGLKREGGEFVGAYDAISSPETLKACGEIVHALGGGKVITVLGPAAVVEGLPEGVMGVGGELSGFRGLNLSVG